MGRAAGARGAGLLVAMLLAASLPGADDPSRALLLAAARGDAPRLTALLAAGAAPDSRDGEGRPALVLAAGAGQPAAVRALVRGGALADAATASGWTALHEAARVGSIDSVRGLLAGGATIDLRDRVRGTPLDVAEVTGHRDVARLLRARGARGSGKSEGDVVCVRVWQGEGYCATVVDRDATRHQLRVDEVRGCGSGCPASPECSAGRDVGPGGVGPGDILWVPTSCLTQTGLRR